MEKRNLEKLPILRKLITRTQIKSRAKKLKQLLKYLKPKPKDKFLEVGINNGKSEQENFIPKNYPYPENITGLSVYEVPNFRKIFPEIEVIVYDGKIFPFEDNCFDIAHANAVIEHVRGGYEAQKLFLSEIVRVSKRGMITTPDKYFPFELHYKLPFIHWRSNENFKKYLEKNYPHGDSNISLLSKRKLKSFIKKLEDEADFKIISNRFFGMTMTFSVFWWKK